MRKQIKTIIIINNVNGLSLGMLIFVISAKNDYLKIVKIVSDDL